MRIVDQTGETWSEFGPYVPAVSERGEVAYFARGERTAILVDSEPRLLETDESGPLISHPVFWSGGVVAYAEQGLFSQGGLLWKGPIGPLGPTTNGSTLAFRVGEEVWLYDGAVRRVGAFQGLQGLPLIDSLGRVSVRCDLGLVREGEVISNRSDLGRFPSLDGDQLIYVARDEAGVACVWREEEAIWRDEKQQFESLRGALPGLMFASPRGGTLGIYRGEERLFGDECLEFALNPVSINSGGQWALRANFAEGIQKILASP